jgi:hypothetical protein
MIGRQKSPQGTHPAEPLIPSRFEAGDMPPVDGMRKESGRIANFRLQTSSQKLVDRAVALARRFSHDSRGTPARIC